MSLTMSTIKGGEPTEEKEFLETQYDNFPNFRKKAQKSSYIKGNCESPQISN